MEHTGLPYNLQLVHRAVLVGERTAVVPAMQLTRTRILVLLQITQIVASTRILHPTIEVIIMTITIFHRLHRPPPPHRPHHPPPHHYRPVDCRTTRKTKDVNPLILQELIPINDCMFCCPSEHNIYICLFFFRRTGMPVKN